MNYRECIGVLALSFFLSANVTGFGQEGSPPQTENLLKNSSFELGRIEPGVPPDDWGFITESASPANACMTKSAAHSGEFAVVIDQPKNEKDQWQVLAFNSPVEEGALYEFSIWVKPDPQNPLKGKTQGQVAIEWKDIDGNEISRDLGEAWTARTLPPSADWTQFKIKAKAPLTTQSATFTVTYRSEDHKRLQSAFLVDDAVARKLSAK
jgi:hypothetical protein